MKSYSPCNFRAYQLDPSEPKRVMVLLLNLANIHYFLNAHHTPNLMLTLPSIYNIVGYLLFNLPPINSNICFIFVTLTTSVRIGWNVFCFILQYTVLIETRGDNERR